MTRAAPLRLPAARGPRGALTALLVGWWLLPPAAFATELAVERVDLEAQVVPQRQALYAKATLVLRHAGSEPLEEIELEFPAPLGPRLRVRAVWDRKGALGWTTSYPEEEAPRTLLVALSSPLLPGKKCTVVVGYDLDLKDLPATGAPLGVEPDSAWLATTGWYPLPAASESALPQALRLTVRVPREWQAEAVAKLKEVRGGALTTYELELNSVVPGQRLLRAGVKLPP